MLYSFDSPELGRLLVVSTACVAILLECGRIWTSLWGSNHSKGSSCCLISFNYCLQAIRKRVFCRPSTKLLWLCCAFSLCVSVLGASTHFTGKFTADITPQVSSIALISLKLPGVLTPAPLDQRDMGVISRCFFCHCGVEDTIDPVLFTANHISSPLDYQHHS